MTTTYSILKREKVIPMDHGDRPQEHNELKGHEPLTVTLTEEEMAQAAAFVAKAWAWADREYKRQHPTDRRSIEERAEDAWEAHYNGVLPFDMAVCPYCGSVPDLNERRGYCCKLNKWDDYHMMDEAFHEFYARLESGDPEAMALEAFNKARARSDLIVAEADRIRGLEREARMVELYGGDRVKAARQAQRDFEARRRLS